LDALKTAIMRIAGISSPAAPSKPSSIHMAGSLVTPHIENVERGIRFGAERFLQALYLVTAGIFREPSGVLDVMGPVEPPGEGSVFDFLKRDVVLLLAALAVAGGLMALSANFAFDRLAADRVEEPQTLKPFPFIESKRGF
jgi:hypothetical protein